MNGIFKGISRKMAVYALRGIVLDGDYIGRYANVVATGNVIISKISYAASTVTRCENVSKVLNSKSHSLS